VTDQFSAVRDTHSEIRSSLRDEAGEIDYDELLEPVEFRFTFELDRRSFVQILGAGVLVTIVARPSFAQEGRRRGGGGGGFRGGPPATIAARIHVGEDGALTVLCGKVDGGQGARCEVATAAAEELRVPLERMQVVLSDTGLTPDDGMTAGSGTTPRTIPSVRQGAAAVRQLLVNHAAKEWDVDPTTLDVVDGKTTDAKSQKSLSYAELAKTEELIKQLAAQPPGGIKLTPVAEWKVLGTEQTAPAACDKITGGHKYPSDIKRPGMLYGAKLRSPTYKGKLVSVDVEPAKAMDGVVVVQDGPFVGVAAPTSFHARQAIEALAATAKWDSEPIPSSEELYDFLRDHAEGDALANPFAEEVKAAPKSLRQEYHIAYAQHAPLEPRTALAEWADGNLTVWTGCQNPFGYKGELQRALKLGDDAVRVIVPDFGSGYGGKHTGEVAVEAARLAKEAGKPVMLRWTREEEFTWAYFRPAGVIQAEASLDDENKLATWHFINIASGPNAVETPYKVAKKNDKFVRSQPPLREGSYRALASTANNFARESFMDELATAAGVDPLEFRLTNLESPRLRAVLEEAAKQFEWAKKVAEKQPNRGIGLACGTEKGSFVAAGVEIAIDPDAKEIKVVHVCEAFECGKILNPDNLRNQVEGAITMGLGPALREAMEFDRDGVIQNATFRKYRVPHFGDVPTIEVHLLDRPDLASAGAGETPIIVVAPAIANAVFHAIGNRIRQMPIRLA
jgi:CO/xanthine dehydrogenase Mo-binding subunit